ncbi:uncharacterized protein LOC142995181 isoform X2 [Genypterus blacodes]|uniref:uncharacterized protein LOC142995181 isoform X2 n=1 Tax=Genypterus blacodes TaxID=154954 RepID=UPI003F75F55D
MLFWQQADSEGELCQIDSLGSAGSSSTLASSVIEVEAEHSELGPTTQLGPNREEEEEEEGEEELHSLSPPPTLSITEEILEFINQSRAREGLASIHAENLGQTLDQPNPSQPPAKQTNFTSPLPPVACPPSPNQTSTLEDVAKMEDKSILESPTIGSRNEDELEDVGTSNRVQHILDETSKEEESTKVGRDGPQEVTGKEEERRDDEKREHTIINPTPLSSPLLTSNPYPSILEEEREQSSSSELQKEEQNSAASSSCLSPDGFHHPIQSCLLPKKTSLLTKNDKKIIEKIRSYYDAAAEAEEDEVEDEEGELSRRRNSFSQIPSGLVKESVSHFDLCGHQWGTESGSAKCEGIETSELYGGVDLEVEPSSSTCPASVISPPSADGQIDKPITSMDRETEEETISVQLQSNSSRLVGEKTETLDKNRDVCTKEINERAEDRDEGKLAALTSVDKVEHLLQEKGTSTTNEDKNRDQTTKMIRTNETVMNVHGLKLTNPVELKVSHKEPHTPLSLADQCLKNETKPQTSVNRAKSSDLSKPSGNLEGLPTVARWSRHSRIVSANRALFESMSSDVRGIGLFEAVPVVDPVLIENSERILSKVQTLAQMYSAKASTLKVSLHQKRVSTGRNQTWSSTNISGFSNQLRSQIQTENQTQNQNKYQQPTQCQTTTNTHAQHDSQTNTHAQHNTKTKTQTNLQHQSDVLTQTKDETQTHSETIFQSQTITQTRQQSQIQTKKKLWSLMQTQHQSQIQTRAQSQFETQTTSHVQHQGELQILEDERTVESTVKRAESPTYDSQESTMLPSEPLMFGHVLVREQLSTACHQQTNGFTLSRPRDFISALSKERGFSVTHKSDKDSLTSTMHGENQSTSPRDQGGLLQNKDCNPGCTSNFIPSASTGSRHELRDYCSAIVTEDSAAEDTEKPVWSKVNGGCPRSSVRQHSTSVTIVTQSAHCGPKLTTDSGQHCIVSEDGGENYKHHLLENKLSTGDKSNAHKSTQAVQCVPTEPEYISTARRDADVHPGEVVLMVVSTQTEAPKEHQCLKMPHPGLEAQRESFWRGEGGVTALGASGSPMEVKPAQEPIKFNNNNNHDLEDCSPQSGMFLQDSSEIPQYESPTGPPPLPHLSYPSNVSFDHQQVYSHIVTKTMDRTASSPQSLFQSQGLDLIPRPPTVQSEDCLPTFTNQRPVDLPTAMGKQGLSNSWDAYTPSIYDHREPNQHDPGVLTTMPGFSLLSGSRPSSRPSQEMPVQGKKKSPAVSTSDQNRDFILPPSAFRPSLRHRSPSPVRAFPSSSSPFPSAPSAGRAPPCSSPFMLVSASSPTLMSDEGFTSTSRAFLPPHFSPVPSVRAPPAYSPTPLSSFTPSSSSSTGRSSSVRAPPPSSPTPSLSLYSSPTSSSSTFSRSLAASCISQSISQSMAKENALWQQTPPSTTENLGPSCTSPLPSSYLRQGSPSPKLPLCPQDSSTPAYDQLGCNKDRNQNQRCPHAYHQSLSSSSSKSQSLPPSLSQRSPSPFVTQSYHQPLSPSALLFQSQSESSQNANNNNNNNVSNSSNNSVNGFSPQKILPADGSSNTAPMQQSQDPLWAGSHNRVARPFSASEPGSRVQSPFPSLSPSTASFGRLCSPPLQHNNSSPMANKPPHPRSARVGGTNSHNPLGLTLEMPQASSASSSSSCLSPRILSPLPIGVSVNSWTHNVAAPQPRNPRRTSSSPFSFCPSSSVVSPTLETVSFLSSSVPLNSSTIASPSRASQTAPQSLRRSFSSNLAERPPSPAQINPSGLRRSWVENSQRSLGFSGQGSLDQPQYSLSNRRSGWSSPSSPQATRQSPLSPGRLTPGKSTLGLQHFTNEPWTDIRDLSNACKGPDMSATTTIITSSPFPRSSPSPTFFPSPAHISSPSGTQTEWGDQEPEEGSCRSQLICAYVARPSSVQSLSSLCLALSPSGMLSPPPSPYQLRSHVSQTRLQPHVQNSTTKPPISLTTSPSPLPFHSTSTKPGSQKTSYATTVNLQIAGSGRITPLSTSQVSLTQTLQAGGGAGAAGGPSQGQVVRRVCINGLSHLPPHSPLPQNCNRL